MVQRMLMATGMVINLIVLKIFCAPSNEYKFFHYLSGMVGVLMKHVRIFIAVHFPTTTLSILILCFTTKKNKRAWFIIM